MMASLSAPARKVVALAGLCDLAEKVEAGERLDLADGVRLL